MIGNAVTELKTQLNLDVEHQPVPADRGRTKLLVSVRDVSEAEAALSGGADIIDVKEPLQGSLGLASPEVLREVIDLVDSRLPVTAALGELADLPDDIEVPNELFAAKVGLAQTVCWNKKKHADSTREPTQESNWLSKWRALWSRLPHGTAGVAVAYADYLTSEAPNPHEVVRVGATLGCTFCLVDTYSKQEPLTELLKRPEYVAALDLCVTTAKSLGLQLVVAGSLSAHDLPAIIHRWSPEFIAVRGAVCEGERTSRICERRVAELKQCLRKCVTKES